MRSLILIADEAIADALASAIAAEADRCGEGPVAAILFKGERVGPAKWFARQRDDGKRVAIMAVSSIVDATSALHRADLAIVVSGLTEEEIEHTGRVCSVLEENGTAFVIITNAQAADGSQFDEDAVADSLCLMAQFGTVSPVILRDSVSGLAKDLWIYILSRIERAAAQKALPQRRSGQDRRQFPRWSFDATATFEWGGRTRMCRVSDVSAGGLGLFSDDAPPSGTTVIVEVPGVGRVVGVVTHATSTSFGLKLSLPAAEQITFVKRMATLIAAHAAA